jgi:hypothetical protein
MTSVVLAEKTSPEKSLFDVRYLFLDEYTWRPICGLAMKTLIAMHRQNDNNTISNIGAWYQAVLTSPNVTFRVFGETPVSRCFLNWCPKDDWQPTQQV